MTNDDNLCYICLIFKDYHVKEVFVNVQHIPETGFGHH
jgi:hypothetical protein